MRNIIILIIIFSFYGQARETELIMLSEPHSQTFFWGEEK